MRGNDDDGGSPCSLPLSTNRDKPPSIFIISFSFISALVLNLSPLHYLKNCISISSPDESDSCASFVAVISMS